MRQIILGSFLSYQLVIYWRTGWNKDETETWVFSHNRNPTRKWMLRMRRFPSFSSSFIDEKRWNFVNTDFRRRSELESSFNIVSRENFATGFTVSLERNSNRRRKTIARDSSVFWFLCLKSISGSAWRKKTKYFSVSSDVFSRRIDRKLIDIKIIWDVPLLRNLGFLFAKKRKSVANYFFGRFVLKKAKKIKLEIIEAKCGTRRYFRLRKTKLCSVTFYSEAFRTNGTIVYWNLERLRNQENNWHR